MTDREEESGINQKQDQPTTLKVTSISLYLLSRLHVQSCTTSKTVPLAEDQVFRQSVDDISSSSCNVSAEHLPSLELKGSMCCTT